VLVKVVSTSRRKHIEVDARYERVSILEELPPVELLENAIKKHYEKFKQEAVEQGAPSNVTSRLNNLAINSIDVVNKIRSYSEHFPLLRLEEPTPHLNSFTLKVQGNKYTSLVSGYYKLTIYNTSDALGYNIGVIRPLTPKEFRELVSSEEEVIENIEKALLRLAEENEVVKIVGHELFMVVNFDRSKYVVEYKGFNFVDLMYRIARAGRNYTLSISMNTSARNGYLYASAVIEHGDSVFTLNVKNNVAVLRKIEL